MAEIFYRKPIPGGDLDAWATYNDYIADRSLGQLSCYLFNDSGTLKLSPGSIGLYDGTNKGTIFVNANKTISIAGLNTSEWARVEVSVSGSSVTLEINSTGDASPITLPASFTGSYNGTKDGFYISASKRCLGVVWINSAGSLEGIVNAKAGKSYQGYSQSNDSLDMKYSFYEQNVKAATNEFIDSKKVEYVDTAFTKTSIKLYTKIVEIGDWNMDTDASINIAMTSIGINMTKIRRVTAIIRDDTSSDYRPLINTTNHGGIDVTGINLILTRVGGGAFDSASYDSTSYNRGWIVIDYIE